MNMKSIISLIIVAIFVICMPIKAFGLLRGFEPSGYPTKRNYGIGVYYAPKEMTIYAQPDLNSEVVEKIDWNYARVQLNALKGSVEYPDETFIAFYPYKEVALIAVVDEQDDWINVVYDQKNNSTGWVYKKAPIQKTQYNPLVGNFYTWFDFMQKIAKNKGLHWISGVPTEYKTLRGASSDDAKPIKENISGIRGIDLKCIRGNWMLIKVLDYGSQSPMGWIRWRDDNGELLIFCSLD